jgi:very-short-patch-repair endonuclease
MAAKMHYGASRNIFQNAYTLRKNMTEAEKKLWERLCKNQLGVKIRRQHPLLNYIADFYCHQAKLVIEVDGGIHLTKENKEYDFARDAAMIEFELKIIRFTNNEVMNEIDDVVNKIKRKIEELKLAGNTPNPPAPKGV